MRRLLQASLVAAVAAVMVWPLMADAAATAAGPKSTEVSGQWLSRISPAVPIPDDLALRFAHAAVSAGLTRQQAAHMLNDDRFAMALGSPDQGWGLLEAMIDHPHRILKARELLSDEKYTASGADSIQNAMMDVVPPLRNAYLKDLGIMAVDNGNGVRVLVDIETGRQYIGQGKLGTQLRAPGGRPLPVPDIAPEEAAARMWAEAESALATTGPGAPAGSLDGIPSGPGLNFSQNRSPGSLRPTLADGEHPRNGLLSPGLLLIAAAFAVAWAGYAATMVIRRFRRH